MKEFIRNMAIRTLGLTYSQVSCAEIVSSIYIHKGSNNIDLYIYISVCVCVPTPSIKHVFVQDTLDN